MEMMRSISVVENSCLFNIFGLILDLQFISKVFWLLLDLYLDLKTLDLIWIMKYDCPIHDRGWKQNIGLIIPGRNLCLQIIQFYKLMVYF